MGGRMARSDSEDALPVGDATGSNNQTPLPAEAFVVQRQREPKRILTSALHPRLSVLRRLSAEGRESRVSRRSSVSLVADSVSEDDPAC